MSWSANAPSNIALIKYMGKKDAVRNIPSNPSLSYTLDNLQTMVVLESIEGKQDKWAPLRRPGFEIITLSALGQQKYLAHLEALKRLFEYDGAFLVQSSNNFPQGTGLASSASSFAALTLCANKALSDLTDKPLLPTDTLAEISRGGSGSSCRSFYKPWAIWDDNGVRPIELPYDRLLHELIIISDEEKKVASTKAHQLIQTSPFFQDRDKRVEKHLNDLLSALRDEDWTAAYHVCWEEFHDMHRLFETATPGFRYMTDKTVRILDHIKSLWSEYNDGPIVTMDAGPNIHLLYRPDQAHLATTYKERLAGLLKKTG